MIRLLSLARVFGLMLVIFSAAYTLPILTAWIYQDGTAPLFLRDLLFTFSAGAGLWLLTNKDNRRELKAKDGFILVLLAWGGARRLAAPASLGRTFYGSD